MNPLECSLTMHPLPACPFNESDFIGHGYLLSLLAAGVNPYRARPPTITNAPATMRDERPEEKYEHWLYLRQLSSAPMWQGLLTAVGIATWFELLTIAGRGA